jgi:hypothetical protein
MKRKIGWRWGGALLALGAIWNATAASLTAFAAENGGDAKAAKVRVLVFDGGHPYDEPEFAEMLTALGDEFEFSRATLPQDRALLAPGLEKRFDALLFYDMCQTPMSDEEFARYETLLKSGKIGVFFLHHRLSSHPERPDFWKIAGGTYVFEQNREIEGERRPLGAYEHDREIDVKPARIDGEPPFFLEPFTIIDESYENMWVSPNVKVLLETDAARMTPQVAWTWTLGETEALVCALGHDKKAYENPAFRRFLKNGLNWLAENVKK